MGLRTTEHLNDPCQHPVGATAHVSTGSASLSHRLRVGTETPFSSVMVATRTPGWLHCSMSRALKAGL